MDVLKIGDDPAERSTLSGAGVGAPAQTSASSDLGELGRAVEPSKGAERSLLTTAFLRLREADRLSLAGRMTALLDLASRLPRQVWYEENAQAHDQRCWPHLLAALTAGSQVIFDLGYTNFKVFAQLAAVQVTWLTRAKRTLAYTVERDLQRTAAVHEALVWIGPEAERQLVRLISVLYHGTWYRYLTNELDTARLPRLMQSPCIGNGGASKTPTPLLSGCWAWPTSLITCDQ